MNESELEEWEHPDYYESMKVTVVLKVPKSFSGTEHFTRQECIMYMMSHLFSGEASSDRFIELWDIVIDNYYLEES